VKFDPALAPVLNWKQFRDAKASTNGTTVWNHIL
jgi:hypothetical protein